MMLAAMVADDGQISVRKEKSRRCYTSFESVSSSDKPPSNGEHRSFDYLCGCGSRHNGCPFVRNPMLLLRATRQV